MLLLMEIHMMTFHVDSLSTSGITLGCKKGANTSWLDLGDFWPRPLSLQFNSPLSQKGKQSPITGNEEGRESRLLISREPFVAAGRQRFYASS